MSSGVWMSWYFGSMISPYHLDAPAGLLNPPPPEPDGLLAARGQRGGQVLREYASGKCAIDLMVCYRPQRFIEERPTPA